MISKIGILKGFSKFTGKHLCWNLFINKVAEFKPGTLSKTRFQHRCFPMNFVSFKNTNLIEQLRLTCDINSHIFCDIKNMFIMYGIREYSWIKEHLRAISQKIQRAAILRWVDQNPWNSQQNFHFRVAFKNR